MDLAHHNIIKCFVQQLYKYDIILMFFCFFLETPFYRSFRSSKDKQQKSGYKQLQNDPSLEETTPRSSSNTPSPSTARSSNRSRPPRPPQPKSGAQEGLLIDLSEESRSSPTPSESSRTVDIPLYVNLQRLSICDFSFDDSNTSTNSNIYEYIQ